MKFVEKNNSEESIFEADEALRRAREATNQNTRMKDKLKKDEKQSLPTRIKNTLDNIAIIAEAIRTTKAGFGWIKDNVLNPISEIPYIGPVISSPIKYTYRAYYNFTHPYEGENLWQATKNSVKNFFARDWNDLANNFREVKSEFMPDLRVRGELDPRRAGVAALVTAWALAGMLNVPIAGDTFNYLVKEPIVDGSRMATTIAFNGVAGDGFGLTKDTLYFGVPTKESGDDIYHVSASTTRHADESNSVSFEVRDRLLHEAWSWANGNGPFRPDYVVGPIRPDSNKCETVSYGSRFRIARWASFRPDILSVSCRAPAADMHAP
ncbi:MAG: hypothetical protein IPJ01_00645 [Micavibrio sp.]|nr:hypothetical protein [Micavibrio sp.]